MPETLANNPRGFAEAFSLDVWRTKWDGRRGVADLHVDIVFSEGRIGGPDIPIRFRLRLRRAEVRLLGDSAGILEFLPQTLDRGKMPEVEHTKSVATKTAAKVKGTVTISAFSPEATLSAEGSGARTEDNQTTVKSRSGTMNYQTRRIAEGYAVDIWPVDGSSLDGRPWDANERRVSVKDTRHKRNVGEAPEFRVELRCKREDLLIEELQIKGRKSTWFDRLRPANQQAAESYIRDEIVKLGFDVGDMSEPFTELLLADAGPDERRRAKAVRKD